MLATSNNGRRTNVTWTVWLAAGALLGALAACGGSEGGGDGTGLDAGDTDSAMGRPDGSHDDLGPGDDAGGSGEDGGAPENDAGGPGEDGGMPEDDAGDPDDDAGGPGHDAGVTPGTDGGSILPGLDGGGTTDGGSITPITDGGGTTDGGSITPITDGGRDGGSILPGLDGGGTTDGGSIVPITDGGRDGGGILPGLDGGGTDGGNADGCAMPTSYYRDCDNDGFAPMSDPIRSCGMPATPPPCGMRIGTWITRAPADPMTTDCNDTNADVNPAQTMFMSMAIAGAPRAVDFDYNCDTREEPEWGTFGSCRLSSTPGPGVSPCVLVEGWTLPGGMGVPEGPPECGMSGHWMAGCEPRATGGMGITCAPQVTPRTQRCR